jgi:type IV pilus assembly protein PilW
MNMQRKQRGMSLIELMISMTIGLIILAGVVNIFIASRSTTRYSEGLQSIQENGRHGVFVMQSALRQAGYSTTGDIDAFDLGLSGDSKITIRHESNMDCTGGDTAVVGGLAEDTYSYDAVNKQINCVGNVGATPMEIVDNIEAFQLLYGLDEDEDGTIERYVAYAEVSDVYAISSVKFALLVASDGAILTHSESKSHTVLKQLITTSDALGRKVFQSSAMIRNKDS